MNSAEDGVIYFSFGTYLNTNEIPEEKLTPIIHALGELKQKVLLRAKGEIKDLPSNVLAREWFFQNEVIAHPKLVLFITQGIWKFLKFLKLFQIYKKNVSISGGLLGVQEAIYHGIPMLLIPFFNEQKKIADQVAKNGHGKVLNFDDITKENFYSAIVELTKNVAYKQKALQASEFFKDAPVPPMQEAMYWMDYCVRYKGAEHLKSPSVNFSLSKYLNYDVAIFFFLVLVGCFLFWYIIVKIVIKIHERREQKGKFKYN